MQEQRKFKGRALRAEFNFFECNNKNLVQSFKQQSEMRFEMALLGYPCITLRRTLTI